MEKPQKRTIICNSELLGFTATFNDANSVIKLNDKELGTIIGEAVCGWYIRTLRGGE